MFLYFKFAAILTKKKQLPLKFLEFQGCQGDSMAKFTELLKFILRSFFKTGGASTTKIQLKMSLSFLR